MMLWTAIQEFQSLIIGFLGFAGVIFTLRFNAQQAREQRRDERHHEGETMRAALIAELKINRESLERNIDKANQASETQGVFVPTDTMDDAYRAFTHRIGLLSQAEVDKVMYAYLSLRTCKANLFLIGAPPDTRDLHVQVPPKNVSKLSKLLGSLIGPIHEAIEVLESEHDPG